MIKIYKYYYDYNTQIGDLVVVKEVETEDDVNKFIGQQAQDLNYGLVRSWCVNGYYHFDCGPVTYQVEAKDLPHGRWSESED